MAIFHMTLRVVQRSKGQSVVSIASDRSCVPLYDRRLDLTYRIVPAKRGTHPILSEILLPPGSPKRWLNRETLWNEVEETERRKDSALAREVEFALPSELEGAQASQLARDYVLQTFVSQGMVADLNVHHGCRDDRQSKPHAQALLTMRHISPVGFGGKAVEWNQRSLVFVWRKSWADFANMRLAELGHAARIDHRSYKERGIDRMPQNKIGPNAARRARRGEPSERVDEHREIAEHNKRLDAST